jgi:hypothetical protein
LLFVIVSSQSLLVLCYFEEEVGWGESWKWPGMVSSKLYGRYHTIQW